MHKLRDLGISKVDLKYSPSKYVDGNGNTFRYRALIWEPSLRGRELSYDVFPAMRAEITNGFQNANTTGSAFQKQTSAFTNKTMQVTNPVLREGITVFESNSEGFATRVADCLSDSLMQKFAPLLPRSLILVNDSHKYLAGLTVIFTYPGRISPAGTPAKYITSKTAHYAEHAAMIAPGDVLLITPLPGYSAVFRPPATRINEPYIYPELEESVPLYLSEEGCSEVEATIDSVIFDDGTLVGPDSANRVESVNNKFYSNQEILAAVGTTRGDELRQHLLYYTRRPVQNRQMEQSRRDASALLAVLDREGEAEAARIIKAMRSVKQLGPIKRRD